MKYKEFVKWCNDRTFDGCWGMNTAIVCIEVIDKINQKPFWKREKEWKKMYENTMVYGVVEPINKKIMEVQKK